jgi:hypothetical protein
MKHYSKLASARTVGGEANNGIESAAEGESSLEVVLLVEAGADARRAPRVLPAALAVVAGALDVAPVLLQTLDVDNLSTCSV